MKQVAAYGHVNANGELKIYSQGEFKNSIKEYLSSASVEITISKAHTEFSNGWRRYYYKYIVKGFRAALLNAGIDISEHDADYYLRDKFLYWEEYDQENDVYHKHPHTLRKGETKVTPKMFRQYCMQCIRFMAEYLNWQVPYINEQQFATI